jgi:membrane-associated phospholipid phosphatase
VDATVYEALLGAVRSGKLADFAAVPRGGQGVPIGFAQAFAFVLEGADPHEYSTLPPPAFASEQMAAEVAEVYWQALTRDVPFTQYGEEPLTRAAIDELRQFTGFADVSADTLFRGSAAGELTGPYISQFLWKDVPYGAPRLGQAFRVPVAGDDHMTDLAAWLRVQNGQGAATSLTFDQRPRYVRNGRDLAEWLRLDFTCQCGWHAALILDALGLGARTAGLPAGVNPLDLVGRVGFPAVKATWYQKWGVHRNLRPEEYGGRIHNHKTGAASYPIHPKLLTSQALAEVYRRYGTYLLPQAYPAGSPPFPSYPANHAAIAAAGITVLKAIYDEALPIRDPVIASDDGLELLPYDGPTLTVGGELNKLAANVAYGRDLAGVHYRSDGLAGLALGEEVAISILRDLRATFGVPLGGFSLTRFDGTPATI